MKKYNRRKKNRMMKTATSNKMKKIRNLVVFGGAAVILGGTVGLVSCQNSCKSATNDDLKPNDDISKSDVGNNLSSNGHDTTSSEVYNSELDVVETVEMTFDDTKEEDNDDLDVEPAIVYMSAEELVKLSNSYADYINKIGEFNTENCNYDKFEAKDLYSAVYLSNIDCFTNEETQRLIDNGIINDDIASIMVDSFNFFNFYQTDTYHKAMNGNKNLIDLSMIFINDKKANNISNTMNTVLNEISTSDTSKISSNFVDTYAFFARGTTLPVSNYDYSKSIYQSDRSQLSVGSMYALSFEAEVVKDLSVYKGVTTYAVGQNLSEVLGDQSNIVRVFEGCLENKEKEQEKSMTK